VNLQLDHFPMIKTTKPNPASASLSFGGRRSSSTPLPITFLPLEPAVCDNKTRPVLGARLSQRVAMDDLASYFVEERSKVR